MINETVDDPIAKTCESDSAGSQVISKKRVTDHGEVYTGSREVVAMLDLVKSETDRIESKFLEPACGTGNFLAEILTRKLRVVESRYRKSQLDFERNAVFAISSIYGIDILEDNVLKCRRRLFDIFDRSYTSHFAKTANEECRSSVVVLLGCNIIHGNALSLQTVGENQQPIVFSDWSFPFNNSLIKRRDYTFADLLQQEETGQKAMFLNEHYSDLGQRAFIPTEIASYPPLHFLKLGQR